MTEMELAVAMQHVAAREMHAYRMAEMVDGHTNAFPGGRRRNAAYTVEDYDRCSKAGMSRKECAEHLGVAQTAVDYMVREYGVKFPDARRKKA